GVGLSHLTSNTTETPPAKIQGAIYPKAKILSNFNLIDENSNKVTKDNLINQWSLVFVGYTHCPDVCPTTMAVLNQTAKLMQKQKISGPKVIFLTVDPERDTAEVLKPYIRYFNDNFSALTGSLSEVKKLSRQLNSVFQKSPGSSGKITATDYLMDHSSALMLINPNGNLQSVLTTPHNPKTIIDSFVKSQAYYQSIHN
ncbi:Cytochrome oxidase biogenesis protein Sco1/SenC/PrrC, thiol-disulfide reductase involved in Cu(I) insertion into CoxII Cu(A) center, partial [hydrothermal vent metagenome]